MQHVILAMALVYVPATQHKLENPTSFKPFFTGEKLLALNYCQNDIPVVYSTYPGPALMPEKTVISCIPEQGDLVVQIICAGEYVCVVNESQTPAIELAKLIKEWLKTKKRP